MDDLSAKLAGFETMLDGFRQVGEMLTGVVAELQRQGWTEGQARDIAVATFLNAVHNR